MYLGRYEDIRKALDELFPGKRAYTDDNEVVFQDDEDGRTRAVINVRKPECWTVTILNEDRTQKQVMEHVVPSATP